MKKVTTVLKEAEYYYHLALNNMHKEQPETVLEYFNRAIAAHPSYAEAWNEKGNFLDFQGKCEEAVQCYDMAIKLDPNSAEAWFNKGLTLKKMGRENEAMSCINRGIEFACGR